MYNTMQQTSIRLTVNPSSHTLWPSISAMHEEKQMFPTYQFLSKSIVSVPLPRQALTLEIPIHIRMWVDSTHTDATFNPSSASNGG